MLFFPISVLNIYFASMEVEICFKGRKSFNWLPIFSLAQARIGGDLTLNYV